MTDISAFIASFITDPFVMLLLGAIAALLQRVVDQPDDSSKVSLVGYLKKYKYRIGISIIGMIVGYSLLLQLGELTIINCFGTGFFGHSIVEPIANKSKFGTTPESPTQNKDEK